ncbi:MAG: thioesterase family protein [Deltaproteobacteria bacterium]|nr:thioesterase family protein [Deltaproteobacteria bacterium]
MGSPTEVQPNREEALARNILEEMIPFNRLVGVKVLKVEHGRVELGVENRPDLMGNFFLGAVHGGVIMTMMDVAAGAAVVSSMESFRHMKDLTTVDMRADFLRMGRGERFVCRAEVLRRGKSLATCRMEFLDMENQLLATGMAVFRILTNGDQKPQSNTLTEEQP